MSEKSPTEAGNCSDSELFHTCPPSQRSDRLSVIDVSSNSPGTSQRRETVLGGKPGEACQDESSDADSSSVLLVSDDEESEQSSTGDDRQEMEPLSPQWTATVISISDSQSCSSGNEEIPGKENRDDVDPLSKSGQSFHDCSSRTPSPSLPRRRLDVQDVQRSPFLKRYKTPNDQRRSSHKQTAEVRHLPPSLDVGDVPATPKKSNLSAATLAAVSTLSLAERVALRRLEAVQSIRPPSARGPTEKRRSTRAEDPRWHTGCGDEFEDIDENRKPTPPFSDASTPPQPRSVRRPVLSFSSSGSSSPDMPLTKTPSYPRMAKTADLRKRRPIKRLNEFAKGRQELSEKWYAIFNEKVFDTRLPTNLEISWSSRLMSTAGQTLMRRAQGMNQCRIQMSSKVLSDEYRMRKTLLHECCHVAQFLLEREPRPPHGPAFSKWARVATSRYPELAVTVTHSYEIYRPHRFVCTKCDYVYARHSKSVDEKRNRCGQPGCFGKIKYEGRYNEDGTKALTRAPTAYNDFVKEHFKKTKDANPKLDIPSVMTLVSAKWKSTKV